MNMSFYGITIIMFCRDYTSKREINLGRQTYDNKGLDRGVAYQN
jgi:hypothetical protein